MKESTKREQISEEEKKKLIEIIKKRLEDDERISFVYLYGSFFEENAFRDIDIGIYIKDPKDDDWKYYELVLPTEIEKELPFKYSIDCRLLNNAELLFSRNVVKGMPILVKDEEEWEDYVIRILKAFADFYPFWRYYLKEVFSY